MQVDRYSKAMASAATRDVTGPRTTFSGEFTAGDEARQHNGNVYNNSNYHYTLRQRRSDETLREDGRNEAFLKAAKEGQRPRVAYLIRLGVDIDHSDEHGFTALHHAALSGFEDVVQMLVDEGCDINASSLYHGTPLHLAALKARGNVVRVLLRNRADVSVTSLLAGQPLHCAALGGDRVIATMLIDSGACVTRQCIVLPSLQRIQLPLPTGKLLLVESDPFLCAIRAGNREVMETLLNKGANFSTYSDGSTMELEHLSRDSSPNTFRYKGRTALMMAVQWRHAEICESLLQSGANVNAADSNDVRPVHIAAADGQAQIIRLLHQNGAYLDPQDDKGNTPLHYAIVSPSAHAVRLLCELKIDLDIRDADDYAGIHLCAQLGLVSNAKIVINAGASIDLRGPNGYTALHLSAQWVKPEMVHLLLECGADMNILNADGKRAIDLVSNNPTDRDQETQKGAELIYKALKNAESDGLRVLTSSTRR